MSNTFPLQAFLAGKAFIIPNYQRDYAWTIEEVGDLFADVQDALETSAPHYLGTIVLVQAKSAFEIVDGQQRLSTLMLMVHALLDQLDAADPVRIADEIYLLKQGGTFKLNFGVNQAFAVSMFGGNTPVPTTRGQRPHQSPHFYLTWSSAASRGFCRCFGSIGLEHERGRGGSAGRASGRSALVYWRALWA